MSATADIAPPGPARAPGQIAWIVRRFLRNKAAVAGLIVVGLFVLVAIFAPVLAPYDPIKTNWSEIRHAPSAAHWFGTDELGRDIFSRIIYGARASLMAGVVSVVIAFVVGVPIGIVSCYVGGVFDTVVMRVIDAFLAIPFLIMAIALAAFLGPSLTNAMIAIGISTAPIFARLARGQTLIVKVEEYIEAAYSLGVRPMTILTRYIFVNAFPPLLVQSTLAIATAIIAEAALAFLGLGQQPPAASWAAC